MIKLLLLVQLSSEVKLLTYPCARLVLRKLLTADTADAGKIQAFKERWRVFTLNLKCKKDLVLEEETLVLREVCR